MFDFSKFCEMLRHRTQNKHFARLNISVLHENATVDFFIVLLKLIHVPYVHVCYIKN